MKKLSIILFALALGLVMTVPAMAIHVGDPDSPEGELGITGRYQFDGETRDIDGETQAFFDDDLDVAFKWGMGDVVAYVSLEMSDRTFAGSNGGSADSSANKVPAVDNYYIQWQAMDALSVKIGEYGMSFGRNIATDGAGASNIQLTYSLDALDISGALTKNVEDGTVGDDDDNDEIILRLTAKEAGPFTKLSVISYTQMNDATTTENSYMGVDLALPIGPVDLAFEYGGNGGDLEGNFMLLYVGLPDLGKIGINLAFFQSSDDYLAIYDGNDWSPVIIYGDNVNGEMLDTSAMWVEFTYDINDKLRVGAQVLGMAENDAGDAWGTEIDLGLNYKIADNISYKLAYGTYSQGDATAAQLTAGDVDRTELFNRLEFLF